MRGHDFDRRVKRIEELLGDPRCTCHGPGLTIVELQDGEAMPEQQRGAVCPVHLVEDPTGLTIGVHTGRKSAGVAVSSSPSSFGTVLPDGRVLIHMPVPDPDWNGFPQESNR